MPPVSPERTIAVTGASGFIGAQIVADLLARGATVRGTVRKEAAAYPFLTALPGADARLTLPRADLLQPDTFPPAFEGVDAVIHTASPYIVNVEDPQRDLVDPAVEGTLAALRAAAGAGVKRVVLTSSMAAISDEPVEDHVFTEADWNEKSSLKRNPYYYSKTLAERAAWRFVEEEEPPFDLVVINPFMVIGPSLAPTLNASNGIIRDILTGAFPGIINLTWGLVDVRDVSEAHVRALGSERARGRYLCAADSLSMKEVVALLKEGGYGDHKLPRMDLACAAGDFLVKLMAYTRPSGERSYLQTHVGKVMRFDNAKIRAELGMGFRPVRQSVLDAAADLVRWGHVPARQPEPAG